MLLRMDHVDVVVEDVEGARNFLERLGLQVVRRLDHHGVAYEMRLPGENQVTLEIHDAAHAGDVGLRHLAFLVDDYDAALAEAQSRGFVLESGWRKIAATGRDVMNVVSPVGLRIQLTK